MLVRVDRKTAATTIVDTPGKMPRSIGPRSQGYLGRSIRMQVPVSTRRASWCPLGTSRAGLPDYVLVRSPEKKEECSGNNRETKRVFRDLT